MKSLNSLNEQHIFLNNLLKKLLNNYMRKTLITVLIILILAGAGYFAYTKRVFDRVLGKSVVQNIKQPVVSRHIKNNFKDFSLLDVSMVHFFVLNRNV